MNRISVCLDIAALVTAVFYMPLSAQPVWFANDRKRKRGVLLVNNDTISASAAHNINGLL